MLLSFPAQLLLHAGPPQKDIYCEENKNQPLPGGYRGNG
jgi:hypothetical protein